MGKGVCARYKVPYKQSCVLQESRLLRRLCVRFYTNPIGLFMRIIQMQASDHQSEALLTLHRTLVRWPMFYALSTTSLISPSCCSGARKAMR